jgi:hypothetical protein
LQEYKELTEIDLEGLTGQKLSEGRAEQRRRQRSYFLLVARLRESQGRLMEALQAYLDFSRVAPSEELLPLPGDSAVKARSNVWVRGRIAELLKKATPEQRKPLEAEMARWLKEVEGRNDEQSLCNFLELAGPETAAGREGRLLLAERLLGRPPLTHFLEAELHLLQVRDQGEDRVHAARAVEMLGQLMTTQGRMADAVYFYRLLRRDFGKTVLPGGKTGADVWDALATDKRFLPYLDGSDLFAARRFTARKVTGDYPMPQEIFPFEHSGEELPFFRRHLAGLEIDHHQFHLQNRINGKDVWTVNVTPTSFRTLLPNARAKIGPHFRYHT